MGTDTREILQRLAGEVEGDYFFVHDRTGQPLTRGVMDAGFRRACSKAGVSEFSFHSLRHTFGTRLGDADVSLEKIARLMGHSSIRMTMRYVHPTDEGLQRALEHAKSTRIVPGKPQSIRKGEGKALQATG
jgi:integrase